MNRVSIIALALIGFTFDVNATDRIVAENGQGGAYATLNDAYTAAVNGDRIIVYPQSSGVPYTENLTIAKDVDILSAVENEKFAFQGTITYSFGSIPVDSELIISGIHIIAGNITYNTNNNSGEINVRIVNSKLSNGYIELQSPRIKSHIAGDTLLNGYVNIVHGKVLGNYIKNDNLNAHNITCTGGAFSNDTIQIIGNQLLTTSISYSIYGINMYTGVSFAEIANNLIHVRNTAYYQGGIYYYGIQSLAGRNKIYNNTIYSSGGIAYGMLLTGAWPSYLSSTYLEIFNNLFVVTAASYGCIYSVYSAPLTSAASNHYQTGVTFLNANNYVSDNGTNSSGDYLTYLDLGDFSLLAGSPAIDAGSQDEAFYDIDLTPNDAGCYGGSYSIANFFNGGAAAVSIVNAPRRVLAGETISIKASGYDR